MNKPDMGDGPLCPEGHGRTYSTSKGHFWCPVSQTLYGSTNGGHDIGYVIRPGDHIPDAKTIAEEIPA